MVKFIQGEVTLVLPKEIYLVNANKLYLECKTNIAICTINLPAISLLDGWGFWIFINDFGKNASVRNIILNASGSDKINGGSSLTINTNGSTGILSVSGQSDWSFVSQGTGSDTGGDSTIPEEVCISFEAGENIGSPRVVMLNAGKAYLFDQQSVSNFFSVAGISKNSASAGDIVNVVGSGKMISNGAFVQGEIYYGGANGLLTTSPPASGLLYKIGQAQDNNTLIIRITDPVELLTT